MSEIICDSPITPVCITSTFTAIEQIRQDPNITAGKVIGKFGPEIMVIIGVTALVGGNKRCRKWVKKIAKVMDNAWMKLVVEPDRQRYAHLSQKKDVQ
ncbi:hypothetical protein K2X92_02505 [Candidatus Gracilibacteria bacterium]|nr:hypothetical protein [Candidatus Gracilibacteria bacterium]